MNSRHHNRRRSSSAAFGAAESDVDMLFSPSPSSSGANQSSVPVRIAVEPGYWSHRKRSKQAGTLFTETVTEYREEDAEADGGSGGSQRSRGGIAKPKKQQHSKQQQQDDDVFKHPNFGFQPQQQREVPIRVFKVPQQSTSSSSSEDEDFDGAASRRRFAEEALVQHNKMRARHQARPLVLSEKLCSYAQDWADTLAQGDRFEHRPDCPHGENLYCMWGSGLRVQVSGSDAVDSWYSEGEEHSYGDSSPSTATGHFTQMVWRDSKELGVARAVSPSSGRTVVVANYRPAGNVLGRYAENVLPPTQPKNQA